MGFRHEDDTLSEWSPPLSELTLVWLRSDLRLHDNPALLAASQRGTVIPVFIWSPEEEDPWSPGAASRWWLHHSLDALSSSLEARGSKLVLRGGPSIESLRALLEDSGATAVYWSHRYEPAVRARDAEVARALAADGIETASFNASLLHEPWEVETRAGGPYRVFTPFWNRCLSMVGPPPPAPTPQLKACAPDEWPSSVPVEDLDLLPRVDWAAGLREAWTPGEAGAIDALDRFLGRGVTTYCTDRDRPDRDGTSRLSPHLHFGELSPRRIWQAVHDSGASSSTRSGMGAECFLREPCSSTSRTPPGHRSERSSTLSPGWTIRSVSAVGRAGSRGTPSWMRGCPSSGRRAGCTIVFGCSSPPSW